MEIIGLGYSGENFSVDREIKNLRHNDQIKSDYSVFITDNKNQKFSKTTIVINKTFCQDTLKIQELRIILLELGLKDKGVSTTAKKPLSYLYIIH